MRERAIRGDDVDAVLPLARIASMLTELSRGATIESTTGSAA